jgi:hypothetical protein
MWALGLVATILAVSAIVRAFAKLIPQNSSDRLKAWERWLEHRRQSRRDQREIGGGPNQKDSEPRE